jgi:hypothetical protein
MQTTDVTHTFQPMKNGIEPTLWILIQVLSYDNVRIGHTIAFKEKTAPPFLEMGTCCDWKPTNICYVQHVMRCSCISLQIYSNSEMYNTQYYSQYCGPTRGTTSSNGSLQQRYYPYPPSSRFGVPLQSNMVHDVNPHQQMSTPYPNNPQQYMKCKRAAGPSGVQVRFLFVLLNLLLVSSFF